MSNGSSPMQPGMTGPGASNQSATENQNPQRMESKFIKMSWTASPPACVDYRLIHRGYTERDVSASSPSSEASSSSRTNALSAIGHSTVPRGDLILPVAIKMGPPSSEETEEVPEIRKRGRPRKEHTSLREESKHDTKHRTKTGCVTCRKRKKKCTEEKPACHSCQKNAYVCTYPETEIYRTGKERAEDETRRASISMPRPLPNMFEGIESSMDRQLLDHFIHVCSPVLSIDTGGRNLFLIHILPMAASHSPLMHAMMALSASHLVHCNLKNGSSLDQELINYKFTLHSRSITGMREELTGNNGSINDQTIALNLMAMLYTVVDGQTNGEYHQHLTAAKTMLSMLQSENTELCDVLYENIHFYATISVLLAADKSRSHRPIQRPSGISEAPTSGILTIFSGLLDILSQVSALRSQVRECIRHNKKFVLDGPMYIEAARIDDRLRQWKSPWAELSDKWLATRICQSSIWIYLRRTMTWPRPGAEVHDVLEDAFSLFDGLHADSRCLSCLLFPTFLLGCCAFSEAHRKRTELALGRLEDYSGMCNIGKTREYLNILWEKMDTDVYASWDWEALAEATGMDFLVT